MKKANTPELASLKPGTAFIYKGRVYVKVNPERNTMNSNVRGAVDNLYYRLLEDSKITLLTNS